MDIGGGFVNMKSLQPAVAKSLCEKLAHPQCYSSHMMSMMEDAK
jgi:hypothetical protein